MKHIRSHWAAAGAAVIAAHFTGAARAQFVILDESREIWCGSLINSRNDYDNQQEHVYGDPGAPWSFWADSAASLASGSFCHAVTRQSSSFSNALLTAQAHMDLDFLMAPGDNAGVHIDNHASVFFIVDLPTPVLIYSRVHAAVLDYAPGFSSGNVAVSLSLSQYPSGPNYVVEQHTVTNAGSTGTIVFEEPAVLQPGLHEINLGIGAYIPQRATADLVLDVMAACEQVAFEYAFPVAGIQVDATVDFAGETATRAITLTGSVKGIVLRDCNHVPIGMRLTSLDLVMIEPSVTWPITPDISVTISDMHAVVGNGLGEPGIVSPISGGCCGTLQGVAPHVTGEAVVSVFGNTSVIDLAFVFPGLYGGIPFNIGSPLAGDGEGTLELDVSFDQVADFGLGKKNPIVSWDGTLVGTGGTCARADLDCNGIVDGADLGTLLGAWSTGGAGTPGCGGLVFPCLPDLDMNGTVDGADLGILLGEWTVQ